MHPYQTEMLVHAELEARRLHAAERRHVTGTTLAWPDRTGALLVTVGERFARAGHRLQTSRRAPAAPCLQGC